MLYYDEVSENLIYIFPFMCKAYQKLQEDWSIAKDLLLFILIVVYFVDTRT